MKCLLQLLKFNSRSGPLENFPDWNLICKFLHLSFDELKERDFEIFSQAIVLILSISGKPNFMERVKCIELYKSFYDGFVNKLYVKRDQEMKNIVLEIVRNSFLLDCKNKPEKLNSLFRNRSFNMVEFILMMFEPYFATNVVCTDQGQHYAVRPHDVRVLVDIE